MPKQLLLPEGLAPGEIRLLQQALNVLRLSNQKACAGGQIPSYDLNMREEAITEVNRKLALILETC